jgi:PmbA protein
MTELHAPASPSLPAESSPAPASDGTFPLPTAELERVAMRLVEAARAAGATAAEAEVSQAVGESVTVRQGEVETIAYNRDKGVSLTVYVGLRRGQASTADFGEASIRATVEKAVAIARYTAEDPCAGLADPERLARRWPDLDLFHPSTRGSRTATARRSAAATPSSSTPTRSVFSAATAARATTSTAR